MTLFEFCLYMWLVCVAFVAANVTDSMAEKRNSTALRRVSAMLMAASTVGLLLVTAALHRIRTGG